MYVAMLFSALLVHGLAPDDLVSGTLIPIPKSKNVNITDSSNYRAIALMSPGADPCELSEKFLGAHP